MSDEQFRQRVREDLKAWGLSQADFAVLAEVEKTTVERWLNGSSRMPGPLRLAFEALESHPDREALINEKLGR